MAPSSLPVVSGNGYDNGYGNGYSDGNGYSYGYGSGYGTVETYLGMRHHAALGEEK